MFLAQPVAARPVTNRPAPTSPEKSARARWIAAVHHDQLVAWWIAAWVPPATPWSSWECVGTAETGLDYRAHGPEYSSAFGMLNQAVRDRADSPASAARILAGIASSQEEIRAAWRETLAFGPHAWAPGTVARCT